MRLPEVESQPGPGDAAPLGPGTGDALPPPHAVAIVNSATTLSRVRLPLICGTPRA